MKKLSICLLTLIFAVLLCTVCAAASDDTTVSTASAGGTWGDITWNYHFYKKTLTISGEGSIPDAVYRKDDYSWDTRPWRGYCGSVTTVIVEGGVTDIGDNAFRGMFNLDLVVLPESLTEIEDGAFYNTQSLERIHIPRGVKTIGDEAFYGSGLREIVFAEDSELNKIGKEAFMSCRELVSVELPDSLTLLGSYAFWNCKSLTSLKLSAGMQGTFYHCFASCESLTELVIPEGVKKIDGVAFYGCTALTELHIPASVEIIYDSAFGNCTALETVTFAEGSKIDLIGYRSFENCKSLRSFVLPENAPLTQVGSKAFMGCKSLTEFHMPDTVVILGESVFEGSGLTCVTLPRSIERIGKRVFAECGSLTGIELPAGVRRIEDEAFLNSAISSISLPKNLTHIGDRAFSGCKFETLTLPERVSHVGEAAFANNAQLNEITFPQYAVSIGYRVLENCPQLEMIAVDADNKVYHNAGNCLIRTDRHELIAGCKNSVIPDDGSVTVIGQYAFAGSTVARIRVPYCVTKINMLAFFDCTRLRTLEFPTDHRLESIGARAFAGCINLERLSLVNCNKLGELVYAAFTDCSRLREVTLPSSLTAIGSYAFRNCGSLERVIYCGSSDGWESISRSTDWDENAGEYTFSLHDYVCRSTGNETHESSCRACKDVQIEAHTFGEWTEKDATKHKKSCFCGEVIYEDHIWNEEDLCDVCGVEKTLKGRVGCFGSLSGGAMLALLLCCGAIALVGGKKRRTTGA